MIFVLMGLTAVSEIYIIFWEKLEILVILGIFDETYQTTRTVYRKLD